MLRESNGDVPDSPEPMSISTAARKAALMLAEQQQYSLRHSVTSLSHNSCDGLRLSGALFIFGFILYLKRRLGKLQGMRLA